MVWLQNNKLRQEIAMYSVPGCKNSLGMTFTSSSIVYVTNFFPPTRIGSSNE